jgi:hypothetical protein
VKNSNLKVRDLMLIASSFALILGILACTINLGGPAFPDRRIPISTESVYELHSAFETAAAANDATGQVRLVISESQLTSLLAVRLETQEQALFSDPQVYLQNGQIRIYGIAQRGFLQASIEIVLTAGIDDQGQLKIELTSADFGPLPTPVGLREAISAIVQEAYTGAVGPAAVGFRLEDVTIADGTMIIIGRTK